MIRKTFEKEIRELKDELLILGSMVEQATLDSVEAMKKRDLAWSERIVAEDKKINAKRFKLEDDVMILIATQQPMARDLRLLASILEISGELERMGDYAKGIAIINLRLAPEPLIKPSNDLNRMAELGIQMLHRALIAFVNGDVEAAQAIPLEDDDVDHLYDQIYRLLMIHVLMDPVNIETVNYLLWAAHNLERLADRVTNICERTVFVATGEYKETRSSYDELGEGNK